MSRRSTKTKKLRQREDAFLAAQAARYEPPEPAPAPKPVEGARDGKAAA